MEQQGKRKIKKVLFFAILLILFIIIIAFSQLVDFFAKYNWFVEVGYRWVYIKQVFSRLYVGVPFFIVFTSFIYIYLRRIKSNYYRHMNILSDKHQESIFNHILLVLSSLLGLMFSIEIAGNFWMEILSFVNATAFGIADPIFGKDMSFYVFYLPLFNAIFNNLLGLLAFMLFATGTIYLVLAVLRPPYDSDTVGNVRRLKNGFVSKETKRKITNLALGQIMIIGVVFFVVLAIRSYLLSFALLYSPRGATFGASFTDINVTLWVYRIQMVVCILSAGGLVFAIIKRMPKIALVGPLLLVVIYVAGLGTEVFVQNLVVAPNELEKERPYLQNGIEFTRIAYGLDKVDIKEFQVEDNLTYQDILDNQESIHNISLNDYRPTREAFNQLQGLRGYYNFHDVDIDRYTIDGKLTQMFLSVREIEKDALDANAKTWINEHLKYTHGYGLTMAPANQITSSGQPNMIIRNVPPISQYQELEVKVPQVYFGELTDDYVIVKTKEKEFDYPSGEVLATTEYEGKAGIRLNLMNRILYAIKQNNIKILISESIDAQSRILINRNILTRAKMIAPFLTYDEDPYAVLVEGKIYYIIDAFTTTSYFPYSEPVKDQAINYMRNSVKVIVDAYSGEVNYYIVEPNEPMIQTYSKIFPGLFQPLDNMPQGFRDHLRYPQRLFDIQSNIYGDYHMTDPDIFYNREDKWVIAMQNYGGELSVMESLYFTFKLPGEVNPEFVLSIPYTPNAKQNMLSFLVARNDGENYGKLILYRFPKNKTIIGPEQVEAKISNDDVISKDLSLWDSRGSQVIRGNILTIPINDSILYVEPLYIRADAQNAIPEVRRIIAFYGDKVVMEDSLDKALARLFNATPEELAGAQENPPEDNIPVETPPVTDSGDMDAKALIQRANTLYLEAQEELKKGSLSSYEAKIKELGEVLANLEALEQ